MLMRLSLLLPSLFVAVESPRNLSTTESTGPTIAQAARLLISGDYDAAIAAYEKLARESASQRTAAQVGLASAFEQTGRYAEGLNRLNSVGSDAQTATWHLARGRLLDHTGRYDDALAAYQAAISMSPDLYEARYARARLLETVGRTEEALALYAFFDALAHDRVPDTAEQLLWHARGFYRYSVLKSHPNLPERTRYVLHELLQTAYEVKDPQFWPARVAAGELLLAKYNTREAGEDFKAALKINPRLSAAEVGLAAIALEDWKFEACEEHIGRALKVNPHHLASLNLRVRLLLTERKYRRAAAEVERCLQVNPNDPEALSLAAAACLQLRDTAKAGQYEDRANRVNPRCALLHHTIGEWLSAGRQFAQAEQRYLKAIDLEPTWAEPKISLGLMYMQWGEEAKARTTLDRAWQLDRFNIKTFNVRQLLQQIEAFHRVESEHFIVKFDAKQDAVLGDLFVDCLERIRPDICRDYAHTPTDKIIVEAFPGHGGFSVRITSKPWIYTVGACTGRVIAMDAPRKGASITGPFDWERVLRHELTHSVTLAATENRIPHWFTEGLAVRQENAPRSFRWMELLALNLRRGRLIRPDELDWSFIRPRRADERELAYAQSEWMVEFLTEQYGQTVIPKMLGAFRQGKDPAAAFREVCGQSLDEVYAGFSQWAVRQVQRWGLPTEPLPTAEKLEAALRRTPKDPQVLGAAAEVHLYDGEFKKADEHARLALESDPDQPLALTVRCTLLMERWNHESKDKRTSLATEAEPLLLRLAEKDPLNPVAPRYLAVLAMEREAVDDARPWLEKLRKLRPHDPIAHKGMAVVHLQAGKKEDAITELTALAQENEHDADLPRRLANICQELGREEEAARWLTRSVDIDPYDVETHTQLAELSLRLDRIDRAILACRSLTLLEPREAGHFARLAVCYKKKGAIDPARDAARRAVELDENSPAKALLNP